MEPEENDFDRIIKGLIAIHTIIRAASIGLKTHELEFRALCAPALETAIRNISDLESLVETMSRQYIKNSFAPPRATMIAKMPDPRMLGASMTVPITEEFAMPEPPIPDNEDSLSFIKNC